MRFRELSNDGLLTSSVGADLNTEINLEPPPAFNLCASEAALNPQAGGPRTPDLGGTASTRDVGRAIAQLL